MREAEGLPPTQEPFKSCYESSFTLTQTMLDQITMLSQPILLFHTSVAYNQGLKYNHLISPKPFVSVCCAAFVSSNS